MTDTKTRLQEATIATLRTQGLAGLSARVVATEAGANQALVFYHFGSVTAMVAAACATDTAAAIERYRARIVRAGSLAELLNVGRELHAREGEIGSVQVMAQVVVGGQTDPELAAVAAASLQSWVDVLEPAIARLLAGNPLGEALDPKGLSRAVAGAFIGLELYDGVDPDAAHAAFEALDQVALLVEVAGDLGPVAGRAVRARLRRHWPHDVRR